MVIDRHTPDDVRMKGFRRRTDVDDVRRLLADTLRLLPAEPVPVAECAGRVLAVHVESPVDVPGFDRAAMDGYAVRGDETFGAADSTPVVLRLAGESMPGRDTPGALATGTCVRIMTGAPAPEGADAVVPAEVARERGETVEILAAIPPGKNLGRRGEDVQAGSRLLTAGRRLRPQDAGLLASIGLSPVPVTCRPRVEIIVTGDELLPPGEAPRGTRIVDSNSVVLAALIARDGGEALPVTRLEDDAGTLRRRLESTDADVVLISGGSSVGLEDHAPSVVAALGRLPVHGVAMRPSAPAGVGFLPAKGAAATTGTQAGERPVFLLPGNPVSCLCAYDFFAGPAIRRLGGRPTAMPHVRVDLPLRRKIVSQVGRVDYMRVRIEEDGVEPLAVSGASILSSTVRADGFVIVARDDEGHAAGDRVTVHLYDDEVTR